MWEPSPEYDAVTLILPIGAVGEGVYVTVQVLELVLVGERVHEVLLNVPPLPPSLHFTFPVGADVSPMLVSVTATTNVTGKRFPMVSDVLAGLTLVELALRTVREDFPELSA